MHRVLSNISGSITFDQRASALEQRIRENDARKIYLKARDALFKVLERAAAQSN
jgi:hypothetical protein